VIITVKTSSTGDSDDGKFTCMKTSAREMDPWKGAGENTDRPTIQRQDAKAAKAQRQIIPWRLCDALRLCVKWSAVKPLYLSPSKTIFRIPLGAPDE